MKAEKLVIDGEFDWFLTKDQRKAFHEGKKPQESKAGAGGHYKMVFKT
jgi:hypothetical protein